MRLLVGDLQTISKTAVAVMNHDVNDWNLLPFKRGDLIQLKERDAESGWFRGEIQERAGWYVRIEKSKGFWARGGWARRGRAGAGAKEEGAKGLGAKGARGGGREGLGAKAWRRRARRWRARRLLGLTGTILGRCCRCVHRFPKEAVQVLFATVPKNRDGKPVLNPLGTILAERRRQAAHAPGLNVFGPPCRVSSRLVSAAYLFGGDDTAVDGTRPAGSSGAELGSGTMRRNTIRGLIRGTFSRRTGSDALQAQNSEQEQADDQRFYLQQRRDASKFTMVRCRGARLARSGPGLT